MKLADIFVLKISCFKLSKHIRYTFYPNRIVIALNVIKSAIRVHI